MPFEVLMLLARSSRLVATKDEIKSCPGMTDNQFQKLEAFIAECRLKATLIKGYILEDFVCRIDLAKGSVIITIILSHYFFKSFTQRVCFDLNDHELMLLEAEL